MDIELAKRTNIKKTSITGPEFLRKARKGDLDVD